MVTRLAVTGTILAALFTTVFTVTGQPVPKVRPFHLCTTLNPCDTQPEEDEPGWDCHTMGNRICGPTP